MHQEVLYRHFPHAKSILSFFYFLVKVVAQDASGNVATGFTGTATLIDLTGTVTPTTSDNFVAGLSSSFDVTVGTSIGNGTDLNAPVTEYELAQNYPNPFNPTTKISYALVKAGAVKLSVFDTRGREIKALVNAFERAGLR